MSVFFAVRPPERRSATQSARVGLTVPRAIGKANVRNRIKRRMRVAIRSHLRLLRSPVDVIVHPRRHVIDAEFTAVLQETAEIFRRIQQQLDRREAIPFPERPSGRPSSRPQVGNKPGSQVSAVRPVSASRE